MKLIEKLRVLGRHKEHYIADPSNEAADRIEQLETYIAAHKAVFLMDDELTGGDMAKSDQALWSVLE